MHPFVLLVGMVDDGLESLFFAAFELALAASCQVFRCAHQ